MYSSFSCSKISVSFMGEKPRARMPKARKNRESVAAGKTCGSIVRPMSVMVVSKIAYHGLAVLSVEVV